MRVIALKTLRSFWLEAGHSDAEQALRAWHHEAREAEWRNPRDIKVRYPTASILPGNRVVFNIKGNKYRLVVAIKYDFNLVLIRFVGTHAQYDQVNAGEI
ncbi:MAG: type II toxin-antitoxin system HigB family toxin [Spirochaetes bacterium]|nr:type II toxin-antitoxin system HigB family toxin [Spirochaetota bacterium]